MFLLLCSLLFALCSLLFALCSLLFALCSLLFALCSLLFALCSFLWGLQAVCGGARGADLCYFIQVEWWDGVGCFVSTHIMALAALWFFGLFGIAYP
jgi:hypothetical protein